MMGELSQRAKVDHQCVSLYQASKQLDGSTDAEQKASLFRKKYQEMDLVEKDS